MPVRLKPVDPRSHPMNRRHLLNLFTAIGLTRATMVGASEGGAGREPLRLTDVQWKARLSPAPSVPAAAR
jgi:hypothetical protein